MNNEVDPDTLTGREIPPQTEFVIYACGKENSPKGTQGSVILSTLSLGGAEIAMVVWNCPPQPPSGSDNTVDLVHFLDPWIVSVSQVPDSGPIGPVAVGLKKGI